MGVITAPGFEPSSSRTLLRHQSLASRGEGSPIVWRYVSTDARYLRDARFTLVPCRDGPRWDKQAVCVCKTHYWFLSALKLFPNARFIGKMEDDTIVHDARLVAELQHAYGRQPHSDLIWYSFFMWAGSSLKERYGAWCGDGDKYLLGSSERHMLHGGCTPSPRRAGEGRAHQNYTVERIQREIQGNTSVGFRRIEIDLAAPPDDDEGLEIAPFATGAIDVRSRKLAENLGNCRHAWKFVQEAWAGGHANEDCPRTADLCSHDSTGTSCDGFQGYLIAKCHDWHTAVTAEHLTWAKFEPTIQKDGLSLHTSVTHGKKANGDGMKGRRLPYKWVYNMAAAMLPLPYELFRTPHGVGWKPLDMNASLEYVQLMRQRDTKRHGARHRRQQEAAATHGVAADDDPRGPPDDHELWLRSSGAVNAEGKGLLRRQEARFVEDWWCAKAGNEATYACRARAARRRIRNETNTTLRRALLRALPHRPTDGPGRKALLEQAG